MICLSCLYAFSQASKKTNVFDTTPNKFIVGENSYRFWQGVASDGKFLYTTSDRDENFKLENIISVYSLKGDLIKEKRLAYTGTDSNGYFMSFGDATVIDGFLFATVYNFNSQKDNQFESKILKFNKTTLELVEEFDIGDGVAESVYKNKDSYWVVYHDKKEIRKFDKKFKSFESYELGQDFEKEGGYQGLVFINDDLYVNLHGSNDFNGEYAFGLDHYKYIDGKFVFVERIKPPTYGSGQGIEFVEGKILWTDRPSNQIVITEEYDIWD